ncbi:MAG TPA: hypothetical protein VFI02_16080, partial [Armatimonadota bacterium]|nr:hypothetical protein [Armatimonadota bacterium]
PHSIADGLRAALTDQLLRAQLIESGRDRASQFTRRRMGERLLAAYSEALHSSLITHHASRITNHGSRQ